MRRILVKILMFSLAAGLTAAAAPPPPPAKTPAGPAKPVRLLPMLHEGDEIRCQGEYEGHVQGIATDGKSLYWSFTGMVVRTDLGGKVLAKCDLPMHGGDPCFAEGRLYVPAGSRFSQEPKKKYKPENFVLVFTPALKRVNTIPLANYKYGAGGMAYRNGHFFIVGGRPGGKGGNTIHEYDGNFKLLRSHEINFNSASGIQTINFTPEGRCLIGCYGVGNFATELDGKWRVARRPRPGTAVGAIPLGNELCLVARTIPAAGGRTKAMAKVYRLKSATPPGK